MTYGDRSPSPNHIELPAAARLRISGEGQSVRGSCPASTHRQGISRSRPSLPGESSGFCLEPARCLEFESEAVGVSADFDRYASEAEGALLSRLQRDGRDLPVGTLIKDRPKRWTVIEGWLEWPNGVVSGERERAISLNDFSAAFTASGKVRRADDGQKYIAVQSQLHVYDYYDFDPDGNGPGAALARLHRVGEAREFPVRGSGEINRWFVPLEVP